MAVDDRTHGPLSSAPHMNLEDQLEFELLTAPRTPTGQLFHYTSTDAVVGGILATGTLRLSPYKLTNDLWESQPQHPVITAHHDQEDLNWDVSLWDEVDQHLRLHTKVGCLTNDLVLPDRVLSPDALRGWSHLALWAHYGAQHAGVCLRFDQTRLIKNFQQLSGPTALALHGPVRYLSYQSMPATHGLDLGQIVEFGVDAAAVGYAEANAHQLFFRKHVDWDNESEYRLVLLNDSTGYDYVDISEALNGVVLGSQFPYARLPELREALEPYPDVELQQVRFHNRTMFCAPVEGSVAAQRSNRPRTWAEPRREGSLAERLAALRCAESEAQTRRHAAESLSSELAAMLHRGAQTLRQLLEPMPNTQVDVHPRTMAVPPNQRARKPGVPGEVVHFEDGFMCVVENLPAPSHTLIAAAALQVLDEERLRLHAVVNSEHRPDDNVRQMEHWRAVREAPAAGAQDLVHMILSELHEAAGAARLMFDQERGTSTSSGVVTPDQDDGVTGAATPR